MRTLLACLLAAPAFACDRATNRPARMDSAPARTADVAVVRAESAAGPAGEYPLPDSTPPLVADSVDVTTVDSAGLGGVPLCAPLENVNLVFRRAVATQVYCPEDGCDTPYPARVALTRAGDTLVFESAATSAEIDRDGRPLVHYAWTSSPRIRGALGAHAGMSVGQILALGERVDVDSVAVSVMVMPDGEAADTLREVPSVLRLHLRREGVVAEVRDSVWRDFGRHLVPGRPVREALDTAARIGAIGVLRERCR